MITAGIPNHRFVSSNNSTLEVSLAPGFSLHCHPGAMVYKGTSIKMSITTGGGIGAAIRRKISGQKAFLPTFTNKGTVAQPIAFTRDHPGECVFIQLNDHNQTLYAQKHTLLFASANSDISVGFHKKFGAALLGPDGFLLQKFTGIDAAIGLFAGGSLIEIELDSKDELDADLSSVLAFAGSVQYDIGSVGTLERGFFGGEGIWLCHLKGPGRVFIQSHPPWKMAEAIWCMHLSADKQAR